eukprot:3890903-Amphidinium_carterae.1
MGGTPCIRRREAKWLIRQRSTSKFDMHALIQLVDQLGCMISAIGPHSSEVASSAKDSIGTQSRPGPGGKLNSQMRGHSPVSPTSVSPTLPKTFLVNGWLHLRLRS